ncbi:hypothetical protein [Domibacillus epiphyticus]|uniref:Uncharacterized protein n=1 Tax=Domibacillus epiphyticus TaxID=1714355 RepID=A0A1V2A5E0_9BACI|nr:hypothetical protein [Domibacillus epiphyticus]OMP66218.1 hypothetical protein BTO28_13585 [Domibacillus epiphyticus]
MAVITFFTIAAIVLLALSIIGTLVVMRRTAAGKEKDELSGPVRRHPYALNPVIWMYIAAGVAFLAIILIVWFGGR